MKVENIIKQFGAGTLAMFATIEGFQTICHGKDSCHLIEEHHPYVHEMKGVNAYNIRITHSNPASDYECTAMFATVL